VSDAVRLQSPAASPTYLSHETVIVKPVSKSNRGVKPSLSFALSDTYTAFRLNSSKSTGSGDTALNLRKYSFHDTISGPLILNISPIAALLRAAVRMPATRSEI